MTITEYIERALSKLEHSLISFDDRTFLIPGRIRKRLGFLQNWDLKRLNSKFFSLANQSRPDFCLVAGGHRILPMTIKKLRAQGTKTVLWTIDTPIDFQPIIDAAPSYDFIFCGGTEAQELLAKAGIKKTHWLPFACDPEIHKPEDIILSENVSKSIDVVFVGSFYPNRQQILERISDFDIQVLGPGWSRLPVGSPLKKLARDAKLKPEEWRKIYGNSKIVIVIHFQDGKTPCYQASPKVYEALACRNFLLVDDQKDIRSLFEDGRHLVVFNDVGDLRKKIRYYKNRPEERKKIAEQGYKEVIQKHTYIHRTEKMIQIVGHENA